MPTTDKYLAISGAIIPESIRHWIDAFDANPNYRHIRFKSISRLPGYIPDRFPARLWDIVTPEEFAAVEDHRLPLFMGSQFGIAPKPHKVLPHGDERIVATFGYSALSGNVAGLFIRTINPTGAKASHYDADGKRTRVPAEKVLETLAAFRNAARSDSKRSLKK